MRRILDMLGLVASCALALVAQGTSAYANTQAPTGPGENQPLLAGLATLSFWWFWRRWRRPD